MIQRTLPVSVIVTVRNEATALPNLLDSLAAQTALPAEIVLVDGGSTDGTPAVARSYAYRLPIRVIERPGANISQGRNAAIEAATHDVIASTDAGVRLETIWLEELTRPLLEDDSVDVVSGFFVADPQTPFERAMGATVLPSLEEIDPSTFLPSSRSVAFRRGAWGAVGGYPEWLDYCEDLVFDMRLRDAGMQFRFAPAAVAHFRPRTNLRAFFKQYYNYARGDGKANLWLKRHLIRYATYRLGPQLAYWGWRGRRSLWGKGLIAGVGSAAAAYLYRPYRRLFPALSGLAPIEMAYALLLVPAIRLTGDLAKMAGYPVGVVWRLKRLRSTGQRTGRG